jgi:hypothetical protein
MPLCINSELSPVRNQDLKSLRPAVMDASQRLKCQPDTRLDTLKFIIDWLINPSGDQNILWLYGTAGCGKSTIATTIASYFRELGRLGAFLFFGQSATSEPSYFMRTLAYQLGSFDPRIGAAIAAAILRNPRIEESSLFLQFKRLILEPLSSLEDLPSQGPVVAVFDALDECGNSDSRKFLLRTLTDEFKKLPSFLRLFITSRPQHDITVAFSSKAHIFGQEFDISVDSNLKDVKAYLHQRLADIRVANADLSLAPDWPGEVKINDLSRRSTGLFVWCSTAMIFIEKGQDPTERLELLLNTKTRGRAESALDDLYVTALQASGFWDDETFGSNFRAILGAIIVAKEPLYPDMIDSFLGCEAKNRCWHTIQHFGCVLRLSSTEPVRLLHPSFADFLSNRSRCEREEWFIDTTFHNRQLAIRCLQIMRAKLTFNACRIETSYLRNDDVPDLITRIRDAVPSQLSYACRFWADHLRATPNQGRDLEIFREIVNDFMFTRLLYWLEALSLLKAVTLAAPSVHTVAMWFEVIIHIFCISNYPT